MGVFDVNGSETLGSRVACSVAFEARRNFDEMKRLPLRDI